ncbi:MAG: hypothetical protein HY078_08430 [Elusimicrobia bacterium]|nr:hypothetical protein [Elusimicrobiota bacterium]
MEFVSLLLVVSIGACAAERDPFAGVAPSTAAVSASAYPSYFGDNFGFRRELLSQFAFSDRARASSRQSIGFEALKKFSSETATVAAADIQVRLVRRDRFIDTPSDMEGIRRPGWKLELHNAYLDGYNILDPLLSDAGRGRQLGRFNARIGRFYLPFGLNLRTDTHGSLLQLSNERDFGFERDWYAGLWGAANEHVNYDAYYLTGSGYAPRFDGQTGLAAARLSLADAYGSHPGIEGGVSAIAGQRLDEERRKVETRRGGIDARLRRPVPSGTAAALSELSAGEDSGDKVLMQLFQVEYLRATRRWGLAAQHRRYRREGLPLGESVIGEATWYLRNDVGNANLHWFKLNIERRLASERGARETVAALQYYRYW